MYDIAIIGAGPAALSAAINAGAEGLSVVVIGETIGGQSGDTSCIENYAGFPEGISGPDFTARLIAQAKKFDVELIEARVDCIDPEDDIFWIETNKGRNAGARSIILALGCSYKKLPLAVPFEGKGVHYSCNQKSLRYRPNAADVAIVGGGNNAGQAAVFLATKAKNNTVHLIIREKDISDTMSEYLVKKVRAASNIRIHYKAEVKHIREDERIEKIALSNGDKLNITDLYVMIGVAPNTQLANSLVTLDDDDFIITDNAFKTHYDGIYAIGDCRAEATNRVANAVGEGAAVVAHVYEYLKG